MSRFGRTALEARIWHITGRALTASQVERILRAADLYAKSAVENAPGRERLAEAAAEKYGRRSSCGSR